MDAHHILADQRIVPVVVIDSADNAAALATTLLEAGLSAIEVTLRTPAAIDAIARIVKEVPQFLVGAGSVNTATQLQQVADVGARFAVSPGASNALLDAAEQIKIPLVPGAATPSEIMHLQAAGYTLQKLFPAELNGGTAWLRAIAGPLPDARFFPTGGVSPKNATDYLGQPNVACIGGTWVAPREAITAGDFESIGTLASAALDLIRATQQS